MQSRIMDQRFIGARESAGFELPNGTFGTMTGTTREDVLRRIDVLRAFYIWCELTNETQIVKMPNGQQINGVPVGLTGQDILAVADAVFSIHNRQNCFALCQRLQSNTVH